MRRIGTTLVVLIIFGVLGMVAFQVMRAPAAPPVGQGAAAGVVASPAPAAGERPSLAARLERIVFPHQVTVTPSGLAIPVAGVRADQLVDTFTEARGGGTRRHNAIDIMAAEGSPVTAAAPGTIEKLYFSQGGGGITVYQRSDDGMWTYYYAHLSAYAPGLQEGQHVLRGVPIGYVGHTGDAQPGAPHLHFAINQVIAGQRWWQGVPINPYPLLAGSPPSR